MNRPLHPPSLMTVLSKKRQMYHDGAAAILLLAFCQLLICGLQPLTRQIDGFPVPILAMALVAVVLVLATNLVCSVDHLYHRYLCGPTNLINRHMSIGFTVPFTMIMNGPISSPRNVGLIIAGYLLTGMLNIIFVYAFSLSVHSAILSISFRRRTARHADNFPTLQPLSYSPPVLLPLPATHSCGSLGCPHSHMLEHSLRLGPDHAGRYSRTPVSSTTLDTSNSSIVSVVNEFPDVVNDSDVGPSIEIPLNPGAGNYAAVIVRFVTNHPALSGSLIGLVVIGIPMTVRTGNDTALDTCLLATLWTGILATQAAARRAPMLQTRPRTCAIVATCLNAVLWSSLGTMAYLAIKAVARNVSIDDVLATFSTGTTIASLVTGVPSSHSSSSTSTKGPHAVLGAGDIAGAVLDAGIVSWGFKLFECRAQLLSRAGLTTFVVGAAAAAANITGGPLLVNALGVVPTSKVFAFAARSVTLALAGPAMANLGSGGDVGLNAAMVVFNGIVFQVAMGLSACHWVAARLGATSEPPAFDNESTLCRNCGGCASSSRTRGSRRSPSRNLSHSYAVADRELSSADNTTLSVCSSLSLSSVSVLALSSSTSESDSFVDVEKTEATSAYPDGTTTTDRLSTAGTNHDASYTVHMRGGGAMAPLPSHDVSTTVAAGIAVGINAAAMGTAHLYENDSHAAPYSALSMTIFGVMTVIFTSIQPLAGWVVAHVS